MTEARVAFTNSSQTVATFNEYLASYTFFQSAGDPLNLLDIADVDTGWGLNRTSGTAPTDLTIGAGETDGSGDAAWITAASNKYAHRVTADPDWQSYEWTGLDNAESHTLEVYGIASSGDAIMEVRANGGAIVELSITGNLTDVAQFTGLTPVAGVITWDVKRKAGLSSQGYISAARLISAAGPSVTLDDDAFEPGEAITGTYANYDSAPTVVTLTDSEDNTISSASEITDLVIDDAAKTYAFTMPARITSGTGTTLLRGDITVELT